MIEKIDHIGIAVHSLEDSLPFYTDILKISLEHVEEVASERVRIAFLRVGTVKIELLEPLDETSPIARFIEKRGEGVHHIALGVESIEERIREIKSEGIKMINESPKVGAGGANIAFLHPKSTGNVLFELCERHKKEAQS
ncbi:methylmalonyl-CoA epimerase [Litchfieldia alkalitelluris]|uniref:methylmalonyl-CoA epimerase n=1 Tax=Litchfieldia alkalitelluris TaxID=304268 RepID=UPI0009980211|nr:methylmalonyl-CoA epimerase [Litchfieldia alkalitelluris]